jgi:predicted DNA-binding transcriptional regulator YafY
MRVDRLLGIVMYLLDRGKATGAELAKHFETSERTIYRDIESLSIAGVPLQSLSGPGGGYSLAERYTLNRSFFSPEEVLSLLGALGEIGNAAKGGKLGLALDKIQAIGAPRREDAAPPSLVVTPFPWGEMGLSCGKLSELLRTAIEERRVLRFSYTGMRGTTAEREVEPFTLALGGSIWYLHGFCRLRGEWRLFRLSRMLNVSLSGARFQPEKRLPAPPIWNAEAWSSDKMVEILLRLDPKLKLAALDSFGAANIKETEEGGLEVRMKWPESDSPLRFLLGFGPGLSVLSPENIRRELSAAAAAIAVGNGKENGGR